MKPVVVILLLVVCLAGAQRQAVPAGDVQKLLLEARNALTAGRFEQAVSGFRSVLARSPELPEALFGLGVASGQLGRMEEAQKALRRYVSLQPSSVEGHSALAMVLLAAGNRDRAKAEFEHLLRLDRNNFEAAKALAHIENGEYNGASTVRLLEPFLRSPEFDDEARLLLAAGYAQTGHDRSALIVAAPLIEHRPPAPPEAFALAAAAASRAGDRAFAERACALGMRAYLNSDELEQSCIRVVSIGFVNELETKLRGSAGDLTDLILAGRLLTEASDMAESPVRLRGLKLLERAVALSPSNATALYNLGRCLRVLARPEQAISTLERALSGRPDAELATLIHTQIALAERFLQHDSKAETSFRRAFELNRGLVRHLPEPAFEFYTFLTSAPKPRDAAQVLEDILRWNPGFLPARMEQARALAGAGRLDQAVAEAELVARNTDPADLRLLRNAHLLLLQLCTEMGRTEDARRHEAWLKVAKTANKP